ncbi:sensor histidine kinase [Actinomadura algeriensis]|uniref:histidine kinase n=1 Tax=Actinomadura algeriensis TaxID=1679523 RepID=A0ABR9JZY4_9ACTN|nr:sensor histidine kinase [Actinomadura algeriensis]MBE1536134.1 signal transduction histidine kinase [Actinomadura algeriensis]
MQSSARRLTTPQDALIAAAALVGGVLMILADGYVKWVDAWLPSLALRCVPLVGLCAAMLLRRTAPLTGLAIATPFNFADVAMGPSLATLMIYGDALYAASLYGRRRTAEWLLGVTVAATLVTTAAAGVLLGGLSVAVLLGAVAGITWVAPVLTAMAVREHRFRAEAERLRAEQVARLAELDRRAAVGAERSRMARELHDVVANHLSAVALHSSAVLKVRDLDRETLERSLEVIRENSVQGLAEMRRMIGLLRDGDAAEGADPPAQPRLSELGRLVAHTSRGDLSARLHVAGDPPELPAAVELAAYRIVQESLTNALKHAGAGSAEVLVDYARGGVTIDVLSPLGTDGARLPGTGSGLIGMRERATLLGGRFDAGPWPGPDGPRWRVRAELPVDPPADREAWS